MHSLNNFGCNGKFTGTFSSQKLFLWPIACTRNSFEYNQFLEFFFGGENWLHAPFAIINLERCCLVFSIIGRMVILVQYENAAHLVHEFVLWVFLFMNFFNGHFPLHKCLWGFFPPPHSHQTRVKVKVVSTQQLCTIHKNVSGKIWLGSKWNTTL